MFILVGLGNPGAKYANNRHNVGFLAADAIARRHSFSPFAKKFQGEIAEGRLGGEKALILKPSTFMNLSGQSVGEAMRFYKLDPSAIIVLYDEIDLAAGKLRIKTGGGAGGHNGIRSIDQHIGNDYKRVRIGVGHPGARELVHNHVLGDFAKADGDWLNPMLDAIADNAGLLAKGEDSAFMNKVSLAVGGNVGAAKPENVTNPLKTAKGQSHIRQARPQQPAVKLPTDGPMAAMLKKLMGKD